MGGHGAEPPKVPDWRIYRVEDVPELVQLQKALNQQGLKDPWLRNEVWRYTEMFTGHLAWKFSQIFFKGFKKGAIAGIITGALELTFLPVHHKYDKTHDGPEHH